jgi:UDP-N-acetylmuramoylalanine--D-glutamate ligase
MKAERFEFTDVQYQAGSAEILFTYTMHFAGDTTQMVFVEKITLADPDWATLVPPLFVTNILRDLHLVLGVSYYKTFLPPVFTHLYALNSEQCEFFNALYHKGLGEFMYRNQLSFSRLATFAPNTEAAGIAVEVPVAQESLLVGIGGGKDSILALELLKKKFLVAGFVKTAGGSESLAKEVTDIAGVDLLVCKRELDPQLLKGITGAHDGHVPVSAIYALLGVLNAALTGRRYMVVANEHSTNFGSLTYEGREINHKWSGSAEFETLLQSYLKKYVTPSVGYFSLTRPFYELRVVREFTELCQPYFTTFTSCNRNFAHHKGAMGESRWCGTCPKCAFSFLAFSAFLNRDEVLEIFKKDLFADETLLPLYKDILGLGTAKPFDCIGTFEEAQYALWLAAAEHDESLVVRTFLSTIKELPVSEEVFRAQAAPTVPTQFRMVGMRSVLILGYGKEGEITKEFLEEEYPTLQIAVADKKFDEHYLDEQHNYDIIVKTPGIPQSQLVRQYTTATQLFLNRIPREQIIGVTGSKGKSSTATMLFEILQAAGKDVRLIGNIGIPALSMLLSRDYTVDTIFVFELSSYQLEGLDLSPHKAIVTSIFPEHMDHHGSMAAYVRAKFAIVEHQTNSDMYIYNPKYPVLCEWAEEIRSGAIPSQGLLYDLHNPVLQPVHMQDNAALAVVVAQELGCTDDIIVESLEQFKGLPHRLQLVGEKNGISFYDDSISTTPESAMAALEALPNVKTIILGGVDRGYDFSKLEALLQEKNVENIILFPESGTHILRDESRFNVLHTSSMAEAVAFALAHTKSGAACVLSPAAPSYNLFKNFEERGDAFIAAVKGEN